MRILIADLWLFGLCGAALAAPPAPTIPPTPPALQSQTRQFNSVDNSDQAYMCEAGHLQAALAVAPSGTLLNIDLVDGQGNVIPFGKWGSAQGFKLSTKTAIPVRMFMTCGN